MTVPPEDAEAFRRLLRAGAVRRLPRSRPRDWGEVVAMARMARQRWRDAEARGEIVRTPTGYRWQPERGT